MKVLFVTYDFPYPINSGGKNRAFNLIKQAVKENEIFLFSFTRNNFKNEYIEVLKRIGIKEVFLYKRKSLKNPSTILKALLSTKSVFKQLYFEKKAQKEIAKIIKNNTIDLVHFESSYTGFYINSGFDVKQVLGTENIEHQLYFDYAKKIAKPFLKPLVYLHAKRFQKEEIKMIKNADICTAVTEEEADFISNYSKKKCFVLENGIDLDEFSFQKTKDNNAHNLLFVGNFTYFPNVSAIKFFYDDVFKNLDKNFKLTIIGRKSSSLGIKDDRVKLIEFVDNIKEEYKNAGVLVFPVSVGGGTNFKILEAMATGVPVVAIADRLKGLRAQDGEHFLKADNKDEFTKQILRLTNDKKLREALAVNARKLIEDNFSWDIIGRKLLELWKTA